jgi:hypothetical protein
MIYDLLLERKNSLYFCIGLGITKGNKAIDFYWNWDPIFKVVTVLLA